MAGRPKGSGAGVRLSQAHRDKIKAGNILNALQEHVMGDRDMSATQITAGLGLLKKCLPDLAVTTIEGNEDAPLVIKVRIGGDDNG